MTAELTIYGPIGDAEDGVTTKTFAEQLKKLGDDVDEIEVRINSEGGSVSQGVAIAGLLKKHPAKIHTIIEGGSFSIASYIAMVGERRTIHSDAIFHTHGPQLTTSGNLADHEDSLNELQKATKVMSERFAEVTGQSVDDIVVGFARDLFFDASEAVAAGYMTDVAEDAFVSASVDPDQFESIPRKYAAALAGKSADKKTNSKGKTMASATIEQLRKKLPDAKADFLLEQLENEATLEQASAAYSALENTSLKTTVAELKSEVKGFRKDVKDLKTAMASVSASVKASAKAEDEDEVEAMEEDEDDSPIAQLQAQLKAMQEDLQAMIDGDDEDAEAEEDDEAEAEYDDDDDAEAKADAKARVNARKSREAKKRTGTKAVRTSRSSKHSTRRKTGSARAETDKRIKERMDNEPGLTRRDAAQAVMREDPDLQDRLIAEANA